MSEEKKFDPAQLPENTDGWDAAFGNHTIGWYRHAAWFAQKIYESKAYPLISAAQAFAILCKGDEIGLQPSAAWTWIYTTKANRLAIMSKGALAVVQAKSTFGGYEERIENEGTPEMRAVAVAIRKGFPPTLKEFTLKDAEVAGLLKERRNRDGQVYDSTYQAYLKDMLLARARGRALDVAFAAELGGVALEGIAEDADRMEEGREPKRLVAAPPRRDPLLAHIGPKQLQPASPAVNLVEPPIMDPALVKVISDQVEEMWPREAAPPPAAQPEPPPPAGVPRVHGKTPRPAGQGEGGGIPSPGEACPRCQIKLNAMSGCDNCGYPGKDMR